MYRKMWLLILLLLILTGCTTNTKLVETHRISNQITETMNGKTQQGVYMIKNSSSQVILYHGVDKGIQTMSYMIEDNVLVISFATEEADYSQDYAYKINGDSSFDSIQIKIDGNEEAILTVFGN